MGYYSEVSILCGRNVAKRLIDLPTLFGCFVKKRMDGKFRFYWKNVRWYDDSDDNVRAVMDVVNDFIYNNANASNAVLDDFVSFIRIGDNMDDVEAYCNFDIFNSQFIKTTIEYSDDYAVNVDGIIECRPETAKDMIAKGDW